MQSAKGAFSNLSGIETYTWYNNDVKAGTEGFQSEFVSEKKTQSQKISLLKRSEFKHKHNVP